MIDPSDEGMAPHQPSVDLSGVAAPACRGRGLEHPLTVVRALTVAASEALRASLLRASTRGATFERTYDGASPRGAVRHPPGRHARRRSEPASSRAEAAAPGYSSPPVMPRNAPLSHGCAVPVPLIRSIPSERVRIVIPRPGRLPRDPELVGELLPAEPLSSRCNCRPIEVCCRAIATGDRAPQLVLGRAALGVDGLQLGEQPGLRVSHSVSLA